MPQVLTAPGYVHAPDTEPRAARSTLTARILAQASATASPSERDRLLRRVVEVNMSVAEAIANRYRNRGIAPDDLRQVAYLALTKAARRFDPTTGHDFLSYAVPTIRGELRRYFRDAGWMVKPPRWIQELQSRIFAAQSTLSLTLGRSPKVSEVAAHLQEAVADVEEALAADGCFTPTSLDKEVGTEGSKTTLGELLGADETGPGSAEARVVLAPAVRRLSERDRKVLGLRFFDDYTQSEIADVLGITQTQVSRILARILRELRVNLEASGTQDFQARV